MKSRGDMFDLSDVAVGIGTALVLFVLMLKLNPDGQTAPLIVALGSGASVLISWFLMPFGMFAQQKYAFLRWCCLIFFLVLVEMIF